MNTTKKFSVSILDNPELFDAPTLQGIVDLYAKHEDLNIDQLKERGLNSIEAIKTKIIKGINFVMAENEEGEAVGARMISERINNEDEIYYWIFSLFTDPAEREKGVATCIEKTLAKSIQEIANKTRKKIYIVGGVEPNNEASINFHIKHGYEDWGTFEGVDADKGKTYIMAAHKFEPEKEK